MKYNHHILGTTSFNQKKLKPSSLLGKFTFYFLLFFSLGFVSEMKAQDPGTEIPLNLPEIIPQSPEVASIMKYGNLPVDFSTGQIRHDIPIKTITVDGYSLPISLSYSYSGFKVEEIPGRMGVGWTLNAGGLVGIQLRGREDFSTNGYNGSNKIGLNYVVPFIKNTLTGSNREAFVSAIAKNIWDGEPDKFSFKMGNESCSFYFNEHEEPVVLPYKNYKIELLDKGTLKIKITNDSGVEFYFNDAVESTTHDASEGNSVIHYLSARYISKIKLPSSREINFEYENYNYEIESISQLDRRTTSTSVQTNLQSCTDLNIYNTTSYNLTYIGGSLIKRIVYPDGEIIFDRESTSLNSNKSVKEIRILDSNQQLVEKFNFQYSNSESTGKYFFLNKVIRSGKPGSSLLNVYEFEYHAGIPTYGQDLLYTQDIWGYYNSNSTGKLLPLSNYSNRHPDFTKTLSGALKKISYPTGGYSEIFYESNMANYENREFYNTLPVVSGKINVGGIRVKSTKDFVAQNSQAYVETTYNYIKSDGTSSAVISGTPSLIRNFQMWLRDSFGGSEGMIFATQTCNMTDAVGSSTTPLSVLSGLPVMYERVEKVQSGNGKEIYEFNIAGSIGGVGFPYAPIEDFSYANGKETKREIKDQSNNLISQSTSSYNTVQYYDPNYFSDLTKTEGRIFALKAGLSKANNTVFDENDYFFETYYERSKDFVLTQTIDKSFSGQNALTTSQNYSYDNVTGYLRNLEKIDFNNKKQTLVFYYAFDVVGLGSLPGGNISSQNLSAYQKLNEQNQISQPIQIDEFGNTGNVLSRKRIIFKDWKPNKDNSMRIVKPEIIKYLKGSNVFEDRLKYHAYDSYGNPLEVSQNLGSHTSYLWGYDEQYPVAKVENATYSQLIGTGIILTTVNNSSTTDVNMRTELNKLRNLTGSYATTYTYDPLIGMTSMTDPSGYTTFYDYDNSNRLKYVKNKDSKVLKSYDYHYKTEITQYTVSSTTNGNGNVNLSATLVNEGESVTVTVTPNSGYQISSIKVNGVSRSISTSFVLSNITSNTVVDVQFSVVASTLTVSPTSMNFNFLGSDWNVSVTASGSWTVTKSTSWITISATSGSGNGSFTIRPLKNYGPPRTGTVTVTQGSTSRIIYISQSEDPEGGMQ
jgi:hypothetical protein